MIRSLATAAVAIVFAASATAAGGEPLSALAARLVVMQAGTTTEADLDDLFRLQLAAGQLAEARRTLAALRAMRSRHASGISPFAAIPYEVYAAARERQEREHISFAGAFARAYRDIVGQVDDQAAAYEVNWAFGTSLRVLEQDASEARSKHPDTTTISRADGLDLVRKVVAADVFRSFAPLLDAAVAEDDQRRYVIDRDVLVTTPDGAHVCALVMRPRSSAAKRLPALLDFTIYAAPVFTLDEARLSAAHGYAGVAGLTRGKGCSPDRPVPIEHDGDDAAALIGWIARQPWSDGRVGMFGGSYNGFTQWSAARHHPKALKAIMPSVTFAPGIDAPMDGNIFLNYMYPWPFYTTDTKGLDDATYNDRARWDRLNHRWYVSGRSYRDLDRIDGVPNPIFDLWLRHPSYDSYWRAVTPSRSEFARIDIPVLTTTGYYDSGQEGALHYFIDHVDANRRAEHYLVIGPYDHFTGQRGSVSPVGRRRDALRGYPLDPVANIDIVRLRYEWFDSIFKNAPKPEILKDRVNYEVMGANVWRHSSSLRGMGETQLRVHPRTAIVQSVDLTDRGDIDRFERGDFIDEALDSWAIGGPSPRLANAITFATAEITAPTEISGLFSGNLVFTTNKKDFDFSVSLFQVTPSGQWMHLSYFWARASYARDRAHRHLLTVGARNELSFTAGRLTSRLVEPGSRIVVTIAILKQPGEQINYGTGKDVSDESVADAGEPLRVVWSPASVIRIPITDRSPVGRKSQ